MKRGGAVLSVVPGILDNAPAIAGKCKSRSQKMPRKPCPPDCQCGLHNRSRMSDSERAERSREKAARYRAAHPDRVKESQQKYHASMPEEAKARKREREQRYRDGNREQVRAWARDWYARNPRSKEETRKQHLWVRHRMTPDDYQAEWDAQEGRCCYCERPLPEDQRQVHIDHDHSCTCGPKNTCASCRRGLACDSCNQVIGRADEDWDRLERIAANGRRLQAGARQRINGKPVQGEFPIDIKRAARRREESA